MVDKREEQFHEENVDFGAARGGNDDRSRCGGRASAPSAWAQSSVDAARAAGLVPSQVDSAFETPITREDFCSLAAAVYRAWDRENVLQTASTGKVSFTDTDNADVLLCASAGVVNGVGNGKFAPDKNITRQEAASMLTVWAQLNKNVKMT